MSRFRLTLAIVVLTFALVGALIPASPTHATVTFGMSEGCTLLNNPKLDGFYAASPAELWSGTYSFYAGDTITVTANSPAGGYTNDLHIFIRNAYDSHDTSLPAAFSYKFTSDAESAIGWDSYYWVFGGTLINVTWTVSCDGPSRETGTSSSEPVPGPEMGLVTPGSVMGQIVTNADAYYAPDKLTFNPLITLPAGKTVWVVGMDATRTYYKIIWSATYLWIKADTIGPNPDKLWQNWPLPDRIVE